MSRAIAVITGGGGDLAAAIRAELEQGGFLVHAPDRERLDVTCPDSVDSWFRSVERIDLLVNNAGIVRDSLFLKDGPENWSPVIDTNLSGAHRCSRVAAELMAGRGGGHLIQIGSYSALHPPIGQTAYAAAKAGLIGLTKSLARELGPANICVNCVLPGFLETRMTADLPPEIVAAALSRHQLGRFNTSSDAARFIAFLATTRHISGQVFQLDSRP